MQKPWNLHPCKSTLLPKAHLRSAPDLLETTTTPPTTENSTTAAATTTTTPHRSCCGFAGSWAHRVVWRKRRGNSGSLSPVKRSKKTSLSWQAPGLLAGPGSGYLSSIFLHHFFLIFFFIFFILECVPWLMVSRDNCGCLQSHWYTRQGSFFFSFPFLRNLCSIKHDVKQILPMKWWPILFW